MILNIDGNLNRYYAQTLCLIYFPGAKFAEDEEVTGETPVVTVDAVSNQTSAFAKVSIRIGDHVTFGEATVPNPAKKATVSPQKVAVGKAFYAAAEEFFCDPDEDRWYLNIQISDPPARERKEKGPHTEGPFHFERMLIAMDILLTDGSIKRYIS